MTAGLLRDARGSLEVPAKMWTIATAVVQHCDAGAGAGARAGLFFCVLERAGLVLGTTPAVVVVVVVAQQEGSEMTRRTWSTTSW